MILGQLVVIDAIDDSQVRAFRRRRDEDALRARLEMGRRLLTRGEDARCIRARCRRRGLCAEARPDP